MGHQGLAGRKWLRRLYKKWKTQTFRNFKGLGRDFHSWAFGPKTVNFVRVYVNSQEPFMASLDILNQRLLHNLSIVHRGFYPPPPPPPFTKLPFSLTKQDLQIM